MYYRHYALYKFTTYLLTYYTCCPHDSTTINIIVHAVKTVHCRTASILTGGAVDQGTGVVGTYVR